MFANQIQIFQNRVTAHIDAIIEKKQEIKVLEGEVKEFQTKLRKLHKLQEQAIALISDPGATQDAEPPFSA